MAKVLNVNCEKFRSDANNKKLYLWGAGKLASHYIRTICKGLNIVSIIDSDEKLNGEFLAVNKVLYPIINEKVFLKQINEIEEYKDNIIVFVTPTIYASEIIKRLNNISMLDSVNCYVGVLMRDFYRPEPFDFSNEDEKIPRKIHYCWFGNKDIPIHLKKYMESWRKLCPDYKIIRWDENNYDVTKNRYMKEAYECKKWGFVPDYARLDIIYNEGGIYLDTDVELLQPLNKLLRDDMFCGFTCNYQIGFGAGFGAIKNHYLIKELRDFYDNIPFCLSNGKLNLKTCNEYQHPVLQKFGFNLENRYQKINGVALYPSEVLSPNSGLIIQNYTDNTISDHHYESSWANEKEKKQFELMKKEIGDLVITEYE